MALIRVSQKNIDNGIHGSNRFCPVGNALHDAGYHVSSVTAQEIKFNTGETIKTPDAVSKRIRRWDGSEPDSDGAGPMYPFAFYI